MQVVKIEKEAVEITKEDWHMMSELAMGFKRVCDHFHSCDECPFERFYEEHECPKNYLFDLIEYLDD